MLSRTCLAVSSAKMSRASGNDRASPSSLVTEGVAGPAGWQGEREAGSVTVGAGEAVIHIDAVIADSEAA